MFPIEEDGTPRTAGLVVDEQSLQALAGLPFERVGPAVDWLSDDAGP
jgi:hypothetical protein